VRQLIRSPADMPSPDFSLLPSNSKHMCLYSSRMLTGHLCKPAGAAVVVEDHRRE